jgi:heme/copper-type cytochrome/quinol oxidase subunit 3
MNQGIVTLPAVGTGTTDGHRPPINTGVLGMVMFLGTETMFFAGLISSFLILRAGSAVWPPPDQPRLPAGMTGFNTILLLASGVTMYAAYRVLRKGRTGPLVGWLAATAALGITFLAVQGYEWVQLLGYGLSVSSSIYGATFYTLIGAHGLHVLAAVIVLLFVLARATRGRYTAARRDGVTLCLMYWLFVVGVWPLLYVLVYLR